MRDAFFYALCGVLLGLAGVTVLARNLFRASLGLLGVLLCTAMLFLLLQAEMVALVQVMVYIGGIMIFVLYAVLLTSELGGRMAGPSPLKIMAATVVSVVAFGSIAGLALKAGTGSATARAGAPEGVVAVEVSGDPDLVAGVEAQKYETRNIASMKALGERLLDPRGFLVPFELVSVLLLAAMVGAIAVARESKVPAVAGKPADGQGGEA